MSSSTIRSLKLRRIFIHVTVLVLIALVIFSNFPLDIMDSKFDWQLLGVAIAAIIAFYLNAFILLPLLIVKKRRNKYIFCTIFGLIIFCIAFAWVNAQFASSTTLLYGKHYEPLYYFFSWKTWAKGLLEVLFLLIPFTAFSFLYYILLLDKERIKKLFSLGYTELIINLAVAISIYSLFFLAYPEKLDPKTWLMFVLLSIYFYGNVFLLAPILLKQKKSKEYFLIITLLSFLVIFVIFKSYNPYSEGFFTHNLFVVGFLIMILFLLSLLYGYIRIKHQVTQNSLNLQLGAKQSELNLLKSQVNPHFLFNTLNTLYGTALEEEAPKTGESISKLANLLRYMQNDMGKAFIPLEDEVSYIKDYIAIQELRCQVSPQVETVFENLEGKTISPGILIPFVENAFKYGIDPSKPSQLSISVICDQTTIRFTCINSYDDDFKAYYKEQGFGLGIKNTKKRLKLIYAKKHSLTLTKENQTFTVKLKITL